MNAREHTHERFRGHRGGVIPMHRALVRLRPSPIEAIANVVLLLAATVGWWIAWPLVAEIWAAMGRFCFEVLDLPGTVSIVSREFVFGASVSYPRFAVGAGPPSSLQWWSGLIATGLVLLLSVLLPQRALPIAYLARLLAVVQLSSQLVFAAFPLAFPYDVGGMTEILMLANLFVIGLVPLLMAFAYNPLAFTWWQRIGATVLPMLHLAVMVPLLYVAHAWVLHHASLLLMPLLFWGFGLVLTVFTVIAFYGWAVSWPPTEEEPNTPRASFRARAGLLVLALLVLGAVPASSAQDRVQSVQAGVDHGQYTDDLGSANSAFVAYTTERSRVDRWRFDFGWASRFEDTGVGIGASYGRQVLPNSFVSAGLSTGTGDVIFPDLRFDVGLRQTGLLNNRLLVDVGYTHIENKGPNSSDGVGMGALFAVGRGVSIGADGRVDVGQPGDTRGHNLGLSVQYGIYRKFYVSARAEAGRVAYLLVGPSDALVEFDSRGYKLGTTWYVRPDRGIGLEYSVLDTDVYDLWNVGLRVFREW